MMKGDSGMKKIVLIILVVIMVTGTAVPAIAINGGSVPDPLQSLEVSSTPIIYCSTPICTGRLKGRIDRTATSVARLLIVGVIDRPYYNNVSLYNWAVENAYYNMTVNQPTEFDVDLSNYLLRAGNYSILYTDGLRVLAQYNFVYSPDNTYLKKVDLSGYCWTRSGTHTTTPVTSSISVPLSSYQVNTGFTFNYTCKSDSMLLVKIPCFYYSNVSQYSPCVIMRYAGPSVQQTYFFNVNVSNSSYPYYFVFDSADVSNYGFGFHAYSQVTNGTFGMYGIEIFELQTEAQRDTQTMVDALNDPSHGSTDQSGAALNDGTNNASDMLNNGGHKEDQLVDGSISGADTSQFENSVTDASLIAGLRFWREFFEFSYNQLEFYQVVLGLCVTLGTLALVLGISGRVHNYRASQRSKKSKSKEGKK